MKKQFRQVNEFSEKEKVVLVLLNLDSKMVNGEVKDFHKIKAAIPTLNLLVNNKSKVVILSHLGQSQKERVDEQSLMPIRFELGRLLQKQIKFANIKQCENSIKFMDFGEVLLIENLNFHSEEYSNDLKTRKAFIKGVVSLADIFINESFGTFIRSASTYDISKLVKSYVGLNYINEVEKLDEFIALSGNRSAIIGGEISSSYIKILSNTLHNIKDLVFYGEVASELANLINNTNESKDKEMALQLTNLITKAKKNNVNILLDQDSVKNKFKKEYSFITSDSFEEILKKISNSSGVIWYTNTPINHDVSKEDKDKMVAQFLNSEETMNMFKVVSGDDTMYIINKLKIKEKRFNLLSVGDFETFEYLQIEKIDVIEVLKV